MIVSGKHQFIFNQNREMAGRVASPTLVGSTAASKM